VNSWIYNNTMPKKVGLYFGSFNPVHIGHMAVANYMFEYSDMDELWFVISPQNPFKEQKSLLADHHRYALVYQAIEDFPKFRACNVEFSMPKPSYTVDTIARLKEQHPNYSFGLIMGSDNIINFHKWKNYEQILDDCQLYVYPRSGYEGGEMLKHPKVSVVEAPVMEISSSFIRKAVSEGKNVRAFLPNGVWNYIEEMHFYEKI